MKIWHISDTHSKHSQLKVPDNIDLVIFSGDCSNPREPVLNEKEVRDFLTWFHRLPIKNKIFCAGNHDTSIYKGLISREEIEQHGVVYLNHESTEVLGLKIFGSPYTPSFGNGWAYNVRRDRLHEYWKVIPDDTDIIVTHGPPKGILDLATKYYGKQEEGRYYGEIMEYCGDLALLKRIYQINPLLNCFGHIHDNEDNFNSGIKTIPLLRTIFSNASIVKDGQFDKPIIRHGNIITL
jgi:Icc-related predicted phosphoesterase